MGTARRKKKPAEQAPTDERLPGLRPDEMPPDVLEFINAIDRYKRIHQRPFPNWSEVLEVLKTLGYERTRA